MTSVVGRPAKPPKSARRSCKNAGRRGRGQVTLYDDGMGRFGLVMIALLGGSIVHAGEDDVDVAALTLLGDGRGHLVAVAVRDGRSRLWYGDEKVLYAVPVDAAENTGPMPDGSWRRLFLDPRFPSRRRIREAADVRRSMTAIVFDGKSGYELRCGERSAALTPIAPERARTLLGAARRERPSRPRPYALARDDRGRYFLVDRGDTPETERRFRVFAGQKGALRPLRMRDVASDSEGDVFSTAGGELRLVLGRGEATWIEPGVRRTLTLVPVDENLPMIFGELGAYAGEPLRTPCDAL